MSTSTPMIFAWQSCATQECAGSGQGENRGRAGGDGHQFKDRLFRWIGLVGQRESGIRHRHIGWHGSFPGDGFVEGRRRTVYPC